MRFFPQEPILYAPLLCLAPFSYSSLLQTAISSKLVPRVLIAVYVAHLSMYKGRACAAVCVFGSGPGFMWPIFSSMFVPQSSFIFPPYKLLRQCFYSELAL